MSEPFLGEIRRVAFPFAPRGWALCDGHILSISQNQALFALLGTTYGGDGRTTFALPDLRGRTPIGVGSGIDWGEVGGEAVHTLTTAEMPAHTHLVRAATGAADTASPAGAYWAAADQPAYGSGDGTAMSPAAIGTAGGNQAHENLSPYLAVTHIIALTGVFPSRD
ncbi:phage tail protein [Streptomyces sp. AC495_CC817]|uniref:phage tail protein n=1 Tax=Streptomyces sp. AC495_CC817 TaxID=2823900 RepID=UPI001C265EBF|nr:tail fiber protein [Streptomyces sp. AC495_CC817]